MHRPTTKSSQKKSTAARHKPSARRVFMFGVPSQFRIACGKPQRYKFMNDVIDFIAMHTFYDERQAVYYGLGCKKLIPIILMRRLSRRLKATEKASEDPYPSLIAISMIFSLVGLSAKGLVYPIHPLHPITPPFIINYTIRCIY